MPAFLVALFSFVLRGPVIGFVILTALQVVMAFLIPLVIGYIAPYISASSLGSAFGGIPAGVWYFLDFFQIPYGVSIMLNAVIVRFIIRRLPIIG